MSNKKVRSLGSNKHLVWTQKSYFELEQGQPLDKSFSENNKSICSNFKLTKHYAHWTNCYIFHNDDEMEIKWPYEIWSYGQASIVNKPIQTEGKFCHLLNIGTCRDSYQLVKGFHMWFCEYDIEVWFPRKWPEFLSIQFNWGIWWRLGWVFHFTVF